MLNESGAGLLKIMLLLVFVALAGGCATHGQDHLFAKDAALDAGEKADAPSTVLASVYLLRPKPFGASLSYLTIPPVYYAANERLVSLMPVGTYVHLRLTAGEHRFTLLGVGRSLTLRPEIARQDVALTVQPGGRYFIAPLFSFPMSRFEQVSSERGEQLLKDAELARLFYGGETIDQFSARVLAGDGTSKPAQAPAQDRSSGTLPDAGQVAGVVEDIATIALTVLMVAAAVAGAAGTAGTSTAVAFQEPLPKFQIHVVQPAPPALLRTTSGSRSELTKTAGGATLRNLTTGTTYTVTGDRIAGSDGSRYRILGSQIVSDTGEWLERHGSTIYTGDGRSCQIIGDFIDCR